MSGRGDDRIESLDSWRDIAQSLRAEVERMKEQMKKDNPEKLPSMSGPVEPVTECHDMIQHPPHYRQYPVEVIDIIRHVLGPEGFKAYCIGNELKYRLRAGDKGDPAQDIGKAMKYREFREGK